MSLQGFRDAYAYDAGNSSFGEQQTSGLTAGQYTQYFNLVPRNGKTNVLGVVLKFNFTLTASGAATPSAGTDALDLAIGSGGDIEVATGPGAGMKCQAITRKFAEFVWAASTNTAFTVAAAPTYASAGGSTVSVYLFVPIGGPAGVIKAKLAPTITAVYASNVTLAWNFITTYIISSNYGAIAGFKEELTASLGTALQSVLNYIPQTVAPDAIFMSGETSTTVTQVNITDSTNVVICQAVDTDVLQAVTALQFAPIAGATYTTSLGFVLVGDQKTFSLFQMAFNSATTHNIGYLQVAGGDDSYPTKSAAATGAPASTAQTGVQTPSGQVASAYGSQGPSRGGGGGAPGLAKGGGGMGGIISRRSA